MAKLLSKLFPKSRKRIKPGLTDGRRFYIYQAGWRALNDADHEEVVVVKIAKDAGCSVGAFYRRFSDKNDFLDFVMFHRLYEAKERTEAALHPDRWRRASNAKVVSGLVEHLVVTMHGDMRGAVRTAFRRRRLGKLNLCPLTAYQTAVADSSVKLLLDRLGGGRRRDEDIRAGVQIVLATVLGSLLQDYGPLRMQRQRTIDALSSVMALHVELKRPHQDEDDEAYSDRLIELPSEGPEPATAADLKRALKTEHERKVKTPVPLKPTKATSPRRGVKGSAGRVHFI